MIGYIVEKDDIQVGPGPVQFPEILRETDFKADPYAEPERPGLHDAVQGARFEAFPVPAPEGPLVIFRYGSVRREEKGGVIKRRIPADDGAGQKKNMMPDRGIPELPVCFLCKGFIDG